MDAVSGLVDGLDAEIHRLAAPTTASIRAVRRRLTRALRESAPSVVLALADRLVSRDGPFDRFIAYELVAAHRPTMGQLRTADLRRLGRGIDSWGDVDTFACYVAGPVWRAGQLPDSEIRRWLRSRDRWWRRAAVVSTVALNSRARGASGDPTRTLAVCRLALEDGDPMVVKALSWALRELAKRAPASVVEFVERYDAALPALVRREVRSKLRTGLKTPRKNYSGRA